MFTFKNDRIKSLVIYLLAIVILFLYLFPVLWEVSTSLKPAEDAISDISLIPKKVDLGNYVSAFIVADLATNLFNTTLISCFIIIGTVLSCSLAGFSFAQIDFPGKNILFSLYLTTMMIPFTITIIPNFFIIKMFGWINTYAGLIAPFFFGNAIGTFLFRQYYLTVPKELYEAGVLDGAGIFYIWSRLMLPVSMPIITALGIITLRDSWNNLIWPLVVTTSDRFATLTLGLRNFQLNRVALSWSNLMAGAVIATFPMIIILIVANKVFIRGIQLSGVNK